MPAKRLPLAPCSFLVQQFFHGLLCTHAGPLALFHTLEQPRRTTSSLCLTIFLISHFFGRNDKYLHLGGPLLAGVTVVALSSLAPMIIPMGIRSLMISESISLYGGLAVFGGFVLYE